MSIALAAFLVMLGAANRLVDHLPNAVALGAISLYAGARLPRRWAFAVPLMAMLVSDAVIDRHYGLGLGQFASPVRLVTYVTFGLLALAGGAFRSGVGAAGAGGCRWRGRRCSSWPATSPSGRRSPARGATPGRRPGWRRAT